jgi:hypothetical protein
VLLLLLCVGFSSCCCWWLRGNRLLLLLVLSEFLLLLLIRCCSSCGVGLSERSFCGSHDTRGSAKPFAPRQLLLLLFVYGVLKHFVDVHKLNKSPIYCLFNGLYVVPQLNERLRYNIGPERDGQNSATEHTVTKPSHAWFDDS